jgi:hypothetical protein
VPSNAEIGNWKWRTFLPSRFLTFQRSNFVTFPHFPSPNAAALGHSARAETIPEETES